MTVGDGLKMFGDGLDSPTLDKWDGRLHDRPDILSESHQGTFCSLPLLYLGNGGGGPQNKLAHNTPITEK